MNENKQETCTCCHGTGYMKSHCDMQDPVCPMCDGTGIKENYEKKEENHE